MADSIKENIMKDIVSSLENIKVTNEYQNELEGRAIVRGRETVSPNISPIAIVFEGIDNREKDEYGANVLVHRLFRVAIDIYISAQEKLTEKLNSLEADVVKAIMADQTRGGYATTTIFEDSSPGFDVEDQKLGGREITFSISYTVYDNDPYSQ